MNINIKDITLHVGDLLLVQGKKEGFKNMYNNSNVLVLDEHEPNVIGQKKGKLLLFLFALAILAGSFDLIPFSIGFLIVAVLSVLVKAIKSEKVYDLIDFRLLVLIGGMTAFGTAMSKTGADKFLAGYIVDFFEPFGTVAILGGFMFLTILLTQPMSNAAAAMVVLPIALQTAAQLDVSPRTFAIGIMMSASVSLITPFEPSCILVYGPGKYRFSDFIKIGGLLTLLIFVLLLFLVPYFWPF
jgi:di/tricarboxylate transporter